MDRKDHAKKKWALRWEFAQKDKRFMRKFLSAYKYFREYPDEKENLVHIPRKKNWKVEGWTFPQVQVKTKVHLVCENLDVDQLCFDQELGKDGYLMPWPGHPVGPWPVDEAVKFIPSEKSHYIPRGEPDPYRHYRIDLRESRKKILQILNEKLEVEHQMYRLELKDHHKRKPPKRMHLNMLERYLEILRLREEGYTYEKIGEQLYQKGYYSSGKGKEPVYSDLSSKVLKDLKKTQALANGDWRWKIR